MPLEGLRGNLRSRDPIGPRCPPDSGGRGASSKAHFMCKASSGRGWREAPGEGSLIRPFGPPSPGGRRKAPTRPHHLWLCQPVPAHFRNSRLPSAANTAYHRNILTFGWKLERILINR